MHHIIQPYTAPSTMASYHVKGDLFSSIIKYSRGWIDLF